jgi:hypothetical protein
MLNLKNKFSFFTLLLLFYYVSAYSDPNLGSDLTLSKLEEGETDSKSPQYSSPAPDTFSTTDGTENERNISLRDRFHAIWNCPIALVGIGVFSLSPLALGIYQLKNFIENFEDPCASSLDYNERFDANLALQWCMLKSGFYMLGGYENFKIISSLLIKGTIKREREVKALIKIYEFYKKTK